MAAPSSSHKAAERWSRTLNVLKDETRIVQGTKVWRHILLWRVIQKNVRTSCPHAGQQSGHTCSTSSHFSTRTCGSLSSVVVLVSPARTASPSWTLQCSTGWRSGLRLAQRTVSYLCSHIMEIIVMSLVLGGWWLSSGAGWRSDPDCGDMAGPLAVGPAPICESSETAMKERKFFSLTSSLDCELFAKTLFWCWVCCLLPLSSLTYLRRQTDLVWVIDCI